jgi:hypothetical protein
MAKDKMCKDERKVKDAVFVVKNAGVKPKRKNIFANHKR